MERNLWDCEQKTSLFSFKLIISGILVQWQNADYTHILFQIGDSYCLHKMKDPYLAWEAQNSLILPISSALELGLLFLQASNESSFFSPESPA
jgi:hypothetical protein